MKITYINNVYVGLVRLIKRKQTWVHARVVRYHWSEAHLRYCRSSTIGGAPTSLQKTLRWLMEVVIALLYVAKKGGGGPLSWQEMTL